MSQIDSISQACPDKGNETQVAPATGAVGDRWLQGWCVVERRGPAGAEEIAYYDPAYWEFGRYADVLREHNIASGNVWFEDFVLDAEDRIVPTGPTGDPTDGPFGEIACQGLKLLRDVVMHQGRFAVHLLERGYAVDHRNEAMSVQAFWSNAPAGAEICERAVILDCFASSPVAISYERGGRLTVISYALDITVDANQITNEETLYRVMRKETVLKERRGTHPIVSHFIHLVRVRTEWSGKLEGGWLEMADAHLDFFRKDYREWNFGRLRGEIGEFFTALAQEVTLAAGDELVNMEGFLRQIESDQKSKIDFAMGDGEDFNRIIGWAISHSGITGYCEFETAFGTSLPTFDRHYYGPRPDDKHRRLINELTWIFMPRGDRISMYYGNRRSEERRGPAKLIVKGSAPESSHEALEIYEKLEGFLKDLGYDEAQISSLLD